VPVELGFALGLFGVFGILRYRTFAAPRRTAFRIGARAGLLLAALGGQALAADEVVGALELGVRHEPVRHLKLALGGQVRLEDFSRVQSWLPEAQIFYEPWKHLTLGSGYRLIYERNELDDFEVAHRLHVQAGLSFKIPPIHTKLRYRLRLQDRFERTQGEPTEHQPRLRNALELSHTRWSFASPFISAEHYLALDRLSDEPTRRWRFMLGLEHESGPAEVELYYRLDVRVNDADPDRHMLGIGVQWEL
jgi:hypothetical protein